MVFTSRYGPTALPIVYRIDGESIALGTWDTALFDEDLRTGIADADYQVGLEADQVDPAARAGWVVLVRGAAHHLDTEAERAPFIGAGLEPWVEGVPAHFIRVTPPFSLAYAAAGHDASGRALLKAKVGGSTRL